MVTGKNETCLVGGRAAGWQLTSPENALCGEQWEAVPQVELHLASKLGVSASSSSVTPPRACFYDVSHHV